MSDSPTYNTTIEEARQARAEEAKDRLHVEYPHIRQGEGGKEERAKEGKEEGRGLKEERRRRSADGTMLNRAPCNLTSLSRIVSSTRTFQRAAARPVSQSGRQCRQRFYCTTSPARASTAQLVKQLRELTGAPMMECKKALSDPEVGNDVQKAKEWLRKHGSAKASSKVAGREANEGLVGIQISNAGDGGQVASLVKVASETDFASRSDVFSTFVQEVANAAAAVDRVDALPDVAKFVDESQNAEGKRLTELLNDAILSIRENLQVESIHVLKTSSTKSVLAGYVHGRASPDVSCGSSAALVELEAATDEGRGEAGDAAKKLAMHVVAAKPQYLNPESVPEDVISKEKAILMEKMQGTNKPPEILEKIITGQLRKFYEGICLTEQSHLIEEGNPKVSKVLEGLGLEAKNYKLLAMGK
ncbi:hypothetical protein THAOC_31668 [Thalassiosira oceanica]|uniref:Elongation factor Ts, mitochondrial n=1 Tax=Thalassiosira oceanica TaxID=159749 RepID=K0RKL5_THAOC|nr:hypothetical protein THAOC_31668 [Thalassiosira oceanica]|eukprot:EJK49456.1 hypothetical protein THAOC_31668 [Thalassiosira oceanica]